MSEPEVSTSEAAAVLAGRVRGRAVTSMGSRVFEPLEPLGAADLSARNVLGDPRHLDDVDASLGPSPARQFALSGG